MKRLLWTLLGAAVLYLALAPVAIEPRAWKAPRSEGYVGPHRVNDRLSGLELLALGDHQGPEDVVVNYQGFVYTGTEDGSILRLSPDGRSFEEWGHTGGRPLGLTLDFVGRLLVADAVRGLLRVSASGNVRVLASEAEGVPFGFTNNVDVARDGRVYFTDATSKFSVAVVGAPYPTSLLDLMEHGGHGRLLEYDPVRGSVSVLARGIDFANGVAVAHDGASILVNETGAYRVLRVWRDGPDRGRVETVIDNLPGFPDNLSRGHDGRYWIGLVAPRNGLLDRLAPRPAWRKVVQRLPSALRPRARPYGHLIAIDDTGSVVYDLQDPGGTYPMVTGAAESGSHLWVASLQGRHLARLDRARLAVRR
ncbi:MAG: SMP-30/gluconolactonase/LRE family protein [Acidobacteria bacterium]|nr:SMP-30/gluconolactonase/LRE family protein [Acidobacteriota bacterium]